jgi:hypothetical protein
VTNMRISTGVSHKETSVKKRVLCVLLIPVLLSILFALSGFANVPVAHAATTNSNTNKCASADGTGDAGLTSIQVCDVGGGNVQVTVSVYSACLGLVTINYAIGDSGTGRGSGNSTVQACTSSYSHTFPPIHATGLVNVYEMTSLTNVYGNQNLSASVSIQN